MANGKPDLPLWQQIDLFHGIHHDHRKPFCPDKRAADRTCQAYRKSKRNIVNQYPAVRKTERFHCPDLCPLICRHPRHSRRDAENCDNHKNCREHHAHRSVLLHLGKECGIACIFFPVCNQQIIHPQQLLDLILHGCRHVAIICICFKRIDLQHIIKAACFRHAISAHHQIAVTRQKRISKGSVIRHHLFLL